MQTPNESETTAKKKFSFKNGIIWLVVFCVSFFAAKLFKQEYISSYEMGPAAEKADKVVTEMMDKAKAEHPEKPLNESLSEAAIKSGQDRLAAATTNDKKEDTAAGQFLGYYLVNVRTRVDYCTALGVDISTFTEAFKKMNVSLYAKSRIIHARSPYSPDAIENNTYQAMKGSFEKVVNAAMLDLAKQNKVSEKEICQAFANSPDDLAKSFDLAVLNPPLYQTLVQAK